MMTDTVPVPVIPSTEDQLVAATEEVSLEDKPTHVHDENCQHDHEHEPAATAEPQGRNDYDLLETKGTKDQTSDPLVKVRSMTLLLLRTTSRLMVLMLNLSLSQIYFEAKEIFSKAMERLNQIPEGADKELIEKHKDEIVSVTSDLMRAFLMDEKACIMNQRILKLAEQYETYVQTYNPEGTSTATVESEEEGAEQQTTIYTKDSVVFGTCLLGYDHLLLLSFLVFQKGNPVLRMRKWGEKRRQKKGVNGVAKEGSDQKVRGARKQSRVLAALTTTCA